MGIRGPAIAALLLLPALSAADDGWRCEAQASWSLCPPNSTECTSSAVMRVAIGADSARTSELAIDRCRRQLGVARLQSSFVQFPDQSPDSLTHIETPCEITQCAAVDFTPSPMQDAFDEPVCIQVRAFVCDLCGAESPLCTKVRTEQPVVASACSDTHTRLQLFSDFLDQVDIVQPGSWTAARNDLCGI